MQRRATGLLVVVALAFVAIAALPSDALWVGYALALAEGSLVGGLADWFAVTALFRHPLGLPIPHTAIIRSRKDQFGATLGSFVQENFLHPDVVAERVRGAHVGERAAAWLVQPQNGARVSGVVLEATAAAVELAGDDDVHRLFHDEVDAALRAVPFAPMTGRALRAALTEGRHRPALDALLTNLVAVLDEQREPLRVRFSRVAPWWLPEALEDKLYDRLIDGARRLLADVAGDPDHELRVDIDRRLWEFADRLEHDPEMARRAAVLVDEVLARPDVRDWTRHLWTDLRTALRQRVDDPESRLRGRLTDAVVAIGQRLAGDAVLQARRDRAAEGAVRYVAEHHRDEISAIITATVARWDPAETSDKLELLLGRDLQFIRINGTVVGGLAGITIHAIAQLLR